MPIQLYEEDGGKILIVQVSGKLTKEDYAGFVPVFERLADLHGKLRVMFDLAGFHGWEASAAWEDVKFAAKHFADIERLAVVGDKKWQRGLAAFGRPFTQAKLRYFNQADAGQARAWLGTA
ncbi:MAG TPA: STAS/SEC14 domain-containing protein [Lacunisphaera sp.]|jgi:hypothetical protein|nr:STAS/SEC14 domain-containing protein [Lacunisphaera sp.]